MAFFNLIGRLGLKTREFDQNLDKSERKATGFAERVNKKVGKKLDKAFGTGLVAGLVLSQVHKLFELLDSGPEMAKDADKLAKELDLTAEGAQALAMAAKDANMPVAEFIKHVGESGQIDQTVKRIQELRKQVALTNDDVDNLTQGNNFWNRLKTTVAKWEAGAYSALVSETTLTMAIMENKRAGMSEAQATAKAKADMAEAKQQEGFNSEVAKDRDAAHLAELFKGKDDTKAETTKTGKRSTRAQAGLNNWQQIGAYVGMPGDVLLKETQKSNQILQRIETLTREQIAILNRKGTLF